MIFFTTFKIWYQNLLLTSFILTMVHGVCVFVSIASSFMHVTPFDNINHGKTSKGTHSVNCLRT